MLIRSRLNHLAIRWDGTTAALMQIQDWLPYRVNLYGDLGGHAIEFVDTWQFGLQTAFVGDVIMREVGTDGVEAGWRVIAKDVFDAIWTEVDGLCPGVAELEEC